MGIEKDDEGFYFPRTFFVEKVSKKEEDIYLKDQDEISVKVSQRVILQEKKIINNKIVIVYGEI